MRLPPNRCLFCFSSEGPFTRKEHPIPESLGNDDFWIDPGYICDNCNQYFGSKVENIVINSPPFGIERVSADIKNKKGNHPIFHSPPHVWLAPTPFRNIVNLGVSPEYYSHLRENNLLVFPYSKKDDCTIARFLIKMGLEILLSADDIDPYDDIFNPARKFSRSPNTNSSWEYAYGIYPRPDDLIISEREDDISPIIEEQIYQYQIGIMKNSDVIIGFMYRTHYFACNLSKPSIQEYVNGFNSINNFSLEVIRTLIS